MSISKVTDYFESVHLKDRIMEFTQSSATVELAAIAVGCEPKQIAKTLSFIVNDKPILIVVAGDARIDNKKFRTFFHQKAKMIPWDDVESYTGHAPGGVCPFAVNPDVFTYLDVSLKRFPVIYPAAGSASSAVRLSPDELEVHAGPIAWIDVCRDWKM